MKNLLAVLLLAFAATAQAGPAADNATGILSEKFEEILNLHHLLQGYYSIRYRYHGNPHKKNENWNYNSHSEFGRPDRLRPKYSEDEAVEQMDNVDRIFPIYWKYFNESDVTENGTFADTLDERIANIEEVIVNLRDELDVNAVGTLRISFQSVIGFVLFVNSVALLARAF